MPNNIDLAYSTVRPVVAERKTQQGYSKRIHYLPVEQNNLMKTLSVAASSMSDRGWAGVGWARINFSYLHGGRLFEVGRLIE